MIEIIKGIGALIAILVALGGLFNTLFSTYTYDSFDIKLMPRNKSSIVKIKKIISTFLLVIPLLIIFAYVNAFAFYSNNFMVTLVYFVLLILIILYIISFILSGLEGILKKLIEQKLLNVIQGILKKADYLYRVNIKMKDRVVLLLLSVLLIIMAGHHISTIPLSQNLERQIIIDAIKVLLTMSMLILVLLVPIFSRKKSVVEFTYLIEIITVQDLIKELGEEYPLNLEYFLNETVSVFSSKNRVYRVIKRLNADSIYQYEVYKRK